MSQSGLVKDGGKTYYLNGYGGFYSGMIEYDNAKYYFDEKGLMQNRRNRYRK